MINRRGVIFSVILSIFVLTGTALGAYKLGQKQVQPTPPLFPSPEATGSPEKRVSCPKSRPEACTMECVAQPSYICGSDGKFYCNKCTACANPKVEWYVVQDNPCEK